MSWFKHSRKHRKAAIKGILKSKVRTFAIRDTSPFKEKSDYEKLRKVINERKKLYKSLNHPELMRYTGFKLPLKKEVKKIPLVLKKLRGVHPIEVKTKNGESKLLEYTSRSNGGGTFDTSLNKIFIDSHLKDSCDWTIRKGTIAHEFQHLVDKSEASPSAVNNIVRQSLLQNFPHAVIVGTYIELKKLSDRLRHPIHKKFSKQINGEKILVYYFIHDKIRYAYAKDVVCVSSETFFRLSSKFQRRILNSTIGGKFYRYIPFAFANVFEKNVVG